MGRRSRTQHELEDICVALYYLIAIFKYPRQDVTINQEALLLAVD